MEVVDISFSANVGNRWSLYLGLGLPGPQKQYDGVHARTTTSFHLM